MRTQTLARNPSLQQILVGAITLVALTASAGCEAPRSSPPPLFDKRQLLQPSWLAPPAPALAAQARRATTTLVPLAPEVGPNLRLNDDATTRPQNEGTGAAAAGLPGHLLVGSHDYPADATAPVGGDVVYYASFDDGRSFPVRGVLPGLTRAHGGEFQGASDPSIACAATGRCWFATLVYDLARSRTGIALHRSDDGGRTWQAPRFIALDEDRHVFHQKCTVAVDDSWGPRRGSVYVSWTRAELDDFGRVVAAPIYLATSRDGGGSFTLRRLSPPDRLLNQWPHTIVDGQGRVLVFYENYLLDDPDKDEHLVQRAEDGESFEAPLHVAYVFDTFVPQPPARFRVNSQPMPAVAPLLGALHVVFADLRSGAYDVLLTSSLDGGRSWSEPVRVNDTLPAAQVMHALPAVACNGYGVCAASFYSTRNDPAGALVDMYLAPVAVLPSPNGGAPRSWAGENVRVSDVSIDPAVQFGGRFLAEFGGLVMTATAAHPLWTDTRTAEPDATGALRQQQDVYTARVTVKLER